MIKLQRAQALLVGDLFLLVQIQQGDHKPGQQEDDRGGNDQESDYIVSDGLHL